MRFRAAAIFGFILALCAPMATARPSEVARNLPGAERVGQAQFQVLAMTLFDAELWTESGAFAWEAPFALSLTYRRSIRAETLASRAISEIARRTGQSAEALAPLRARLETCFADVRADDRITGVSTGANSARFYLNDAARCSVTWPGFRRAFFGIWLDTEDRGAFARRLRGDA